MAESVKKIIQKVPIFKKIKKIDKIQGGITNQNYKITLNDNKKFFVRICKEIPEHLISRENEISASTAASEIGVSPKVIYYNNELIVFNYIQGKSLSEKNIQENLTKIVSLLKSSYKHTKKNSTPQIFWVFHVIRHYKIFRKK